MKTAAPSRFSLRTLSPTAHALRTLADLTSAADGLPELAWHVDPVYGVTGTAHGDDERVIAVVRKWAAEFGGKPQTMEARPAVIDGEVAIEAGWTVAHLRVAGLKVTVAGRLTELAEVAW